MQRGTTLQPAFYRSWLANDWHLPGAKQMTMTLANPRDLIKTI
jgi:hypothetical protein